MNTIFEGTINEHGNDIDTQEKEIPACEIIEDDNSGHRSETLSNLLEFLSRMSDRSSGNHDDEEDEDEDEYEADEEDDAGDYDEDDEDYEDEDDDDRVTRKASPEKVPVGKRVILRNDYKNNKAYCDAVVKSMQSVLRMHGIRESARDIRENVKVFAFDRSTRGIDIDCHILIEYERCNFRIEFKFNVDNQPGRTPLIDYFCQEKNFPLRYGSIIMDHNDDEKKFEYSSCFHGAFSEEAFARYWDALDSTLKIYAKEFASIASDKKLDSDQRKIARQMIRDLSTNLPARVKPEHEDVFNRAVEALGGNLSAKEKKLLNYLVQNVS